jgi:putative ABC transport system permease protein
MFLNYIKTAYRNILRNKGYAAINIAGLALGLAIFSMAALLAEFHFGFDKFHKDFERIYSVVQTFAKAEKDVDHSDRTPAPLKELLANEFPEIEEATRWIYLDEMSVKYKDKKFYEKGATAMAVDSNFLSFFSFALISGETETALEEPNSVVLTEAAARKYFGFENPLGKTLTVMLYGELPLKVTGVTKDVPLNSTLKYHLLISSKTFNFDDNWHVWGATFVKLAENNDSNRLKHKFAAFIETHLSGLTVVPKDLYLLALADLHLRSFHVQGVWQKDVQNAYLLVLAAGIAMLLVVCFNFMNLATAQYVTRYGEVGVRKVMGSSELQLMLQFLGESILMALIAFPLAIVLNELMRPLFDAFVGNDIIGEIGPRLLNSPIMMLKCLAVTILVGAAAGSYPALFLARLRPVKILRGDLQTGKKGMLIRQVLVVTQFIVSIFCVIFAISIIKLNNYLYHLDLGYSRDKVMVARVGYGKLSPELETLKNELKKHPKIVSLSAALWTPIGWGTVFRVIPKGGSERDAWIWNVYGVDYDYIELLEMKMVKGRSFSRDHDESSSLIINETAARQLGWKDPIGRQLTVRNFKGVIVGVVKDYHFSDLFSSIRPSVMYIRKDFLQILYIKLSHDPDSEVIEYIKDQWGLFIPDLPFEYSTLDEHFKDLYLPLKQFGMLVGTIGLVAIFFSGLGLFGLSTYATRRRIKEIGIRKAHGATFREIVQLLLTEFFRLIILANVIALPITYYVTKAILHEIQTYPVNIGISLFILIGFLSLLIAFSAVIYQTYKAATANPINSLRYE